MVQDLARDDNSKLQLEDATTTLEVTSSSLSLCSQVSERKENEESESSNTRKANQNPPPLCQFFLCRCAVFSHTGIAWRVSQRICSSTTSHNLHVGGILNGVMSCFSYSVFFFFSSFKGLMSTHTYVYDDAVWQGQLGSHNKILQMGHEFWRPSNLEWPPYSQTKLGMVKEAELLSHSLQQLNSPDCFFHPWCSVHVQHAIWNPLEPIPQLQKIK